MKFSSRVGILIFEYRYYRNIEYVFSNFLNIEININIYNKISILSKLISIFILISISNPVCKSYCLNQPLFNSSSRRCCSSRAGSIVKRRIRLTQPNMMPQMAMRYASMYNLIASRRTASDAFGRAIFARATSVSISARVPKGQHSSKANALRPKQRAKSVKNKEIYFVSAEKCIILVQISYDFFNY